MAYPLNGTLTFIAVLSIIFYFILAIALAPLGITVMHSNTSIMMIIILNGVCVISLSKLSVRRSNKLNRSHTIILSVLVSLLVTGAAVSLIYAGAYALSPDPSRATMSEYVSGGLYDCLAQGTIYGTLVVVYLIVLNPKRPLGSNEEAR